MKEILKSKVMIGFIVIVLGIVYINCEIDTKKDSCGLTANMNQINFLQK